MKHFPKQLLVATLTAACISFLLFTYGINPVYRILCPVLFDLCVYQGNFLIEAIYNIFFVVTASAYILALRYIAKLPLSVAVFASVSSLLAESILSPILTGLPSTFIPIQLLFAAMSLIVLTSHAAVFAILFNKKPSFAPFIGAALWLLYGFLLWAVIPSL